MNISIEELYNKLLNDNNIIVNDNNNVIISVNNVSIKTFGYKYVNIKAMSRHYVTKDKFRICVVLAGYEKIIFTTNDHTCIYLNDEFEFENVKASELSVDDCIPIILNGEELLGVIKSIDNLGPWNEYVYDLEVEDNSHLFYANDILIHNSQFIDISPIVKNYISNNKLDIENISGLSQEQLDEVISEIDDFVSNDVNNYIKNLINAECHTTRGDNLHYSREYVATQGMFFKKKHYIVHIVKKDDSTVDQFKYSGVSVKKAEIPADMKVYLKNIFEETCLKNWHESDYRKYVDKVFDEFLQKDYEHISIYKGYNTEKASTGFMESQKGTGAHARAANIYNQLIDDLKISNKYEKINVGDQLRYCYVNDTNNYGINIIAFKENIPDEFKSIFTINYELMFEKIFLKSLKGYVEIMKFNDYSPSNKSICDISEL